MAKKRTGKKRTGTRRARKSTSLTQYNSGHSSPITKVGALPQAAPLTTAQRAKEAAKRAALETKHMLTSTAVSAAIGYADGKGMLTSVPTVGGFDATGMIGGGLFVLSKITKSKFLDHAATGALNVAIYNMAKNAAAEQASAGYEEEEWVEE